MQIPLEFSFRNMDRSEAVEARVREKAAELEQFHDRITGCRVVVETPHRHQRRGKHFHVRVDVAVPGREIVVKRDPDENTRHQDAYATLNDAFAAAKRQLQDYARERRNQTKQQDVPPHGRVTKLFPEEAHGFLETPDGREVHSQENSVLDGFENLTIGPKVRFVEKAGEKGPQASSLRQVGRHHRLPNE
jgi:ribosomal subunit interface protein